MDRFCTECGNDLDGTQFCTNCGCAASTVSTTANTVASAVTPPVHAPPKQVPPVTGPSSNPLGTLPTAPKPARCVVCGGAMLPNTGFECDTCHARARTTAKALHGPIVATAPPPTSATQNTSPYLPPPRNSSRSKARASMFASLTVIAVLIILGLWNANKGSSGTGSGNYTPFVPTPALSSPASGGYVPPRSTYVPEAQMQRSDQDQRNSEEWQRQWQRQWDEEKQKMHRDYEAQNGPDQNAASEGATASPADQQFDDLLTSFQYNQQQADNLFQTANGVGGYEFVMGMVKIANQMMQILPTISLARRSQAYACRTAANMALKRQTGM